MPTRFVRANTRRANISRKNPRKIVSGSLPPSVEVEPKRTVRIYFPSEYPLGPGRALLAGFLLAAGGEVVSPHWPLVPREDGRRPAGVKLSQQRLWIAGYADANPKNADCVAA
jgi:hypothetical protein